MKILFYIGVCISLVFLGALTGANTGCGAGLNPLLIADGSDGGGGGGGGGGSDEELEGDGVILPATSLTAMPNNAFNTVDWNHLAEADLYRLFKTGAIDPTLLTTIDISAVETVEEAVALLEQNGISYSSLDIDSLTYDDTGLTNGQAYCYLVSILAGDEQGPPSNGACAIPTGDPVPTATGKSFIVDVSWDAVDGAAAYNLYGATVVPWTASISKTNSIGGELLATIEDTGSDSYSFDDIVNSNCLDRLYEVRVVNELGQEVAAVNEVRGVPSTEGVLDETFAVAGILEEDSVLGRFSDVALDSNENIVATISAGLFGGLVEYNSDGTEILWGQFDLNILVGMVSAEAVVVDAEDNIFITGSTLSSMMTCKFSSDGTLDERFGSSGCYNIPMVEGTRGYDIALDVLGNVLVTGIDSNKLVVWRLTPAGVLDTSFGVSGRYVHVDATADQTEGRAIVNDPVDGSIYVAGKYVPNIIIDDEPSFLLVKLDADGVEINSLMDDGLGGESSGLGATLAKDLGSGVLIVTGRTKANPPDPEDVQFIVWYIDADLNIISSSVYSQGDENRGEDVLIDCRKRVVASGAAGNVGSVGTVALRTDVDLLATGLLDDAFGNIDSQNGWFLYDNLSAVDGGFAVVEYEDGGLLIGGRVELPGAVRPALWRLK